MLSSSDKMSIKTRTNHQAAKVTTYSPRAHHPYVLTDSFIHTRSESL